MKNFLVKGAIILFFIAGAFGATRAQVVGHQMQGTIKPGSVANTVDIYFKADFSNTSEYFTNLNITIAIPTPATPPNPTLTVTNSLIPTFPLANWTGFAVLPAEVIGGYTVFAYNVVRSGTTPFAFTAGTEFKVATIAFSGNFDPSVLVRLADYASLNGGNSGFAAFYVETNVSSQISSPTSANMFYASPSNSTIGMQGPDGYAQTIAVASSHQIQGTIKPGAVANTVDIYFKPDYSNTTEYFTNLNITIAVPTSVTPPNPVLTVINSLIPTFPLANWTGFAVLPVETIGSYTVFAYNVVRSGTTPFAFTAGTEFKVATIAFSGNFGKSALIRLADYASLNGGNSGFAAFYVETNVSSQVSSPLSANMFYASPSNSTIGMQGPDGYAQTLTAIVLPVTYTSFTGTASGCSANLAWQTATEQNSAYYNVEYSTDGVIFNTIGKVMSKNSATGTSYSFNYNKLAGGVSFFRLNAIDFDGKSAYSQIVTVTGTGACGTTYQIKVSPNPTTSVINVQGLTSGSHLSLIDVNGKKLTEVVATSTNQAIYVGTYAKGMYILRIQTAEGVTSNVKVVKQ